MRLVGLLLAGLGGFIVFEVLQGQRPQDHLRQLIDLFGHQHLTGAGAKGQESAPGNPSAGGATPGGALVSA